LVSLSLARPSPRHDDGRPRRIATSGAVVAPRNKNKSTDRHTIQRSSPATGHRRRGGCYRVYEPTTGGGFSPAAPLPTSRPQHALSDSTHVPLPPEAFDGPAHGEADLLLPPELSRLQQTSIDDEQTRSGALVPPTSIQYMPGRTRQIRARGEDGTASPRVELLSSKGEHIAITTGWGSHRNDSTTKGGR
jgi:hypothetical protein